MPNLAFDPSYDAFDILESARRTKVRAIFTRASPQPVLRGKQKAPIAVKADKVMIESIPTSIGYLFALPAFQIQ